MLNRAKRCTATVENNTPLKKSKTKGVDKPLLIISKKQGQYNVEMQTAPEQGSSEYKPLIYKIASASNEEKVRRREKKERRLVRNVIKEFRDPYHPQLCEQSCYCAYKDAVGFFEDVPEVNKDTAEPLTESPSSSDEDDSDSSSLDLDWEIHFTPPKARNNDSKSNKSLNIV